MPVLRLLTLNYDKNQGKNESENKMVFVFRCRCLPGSFLLFGVLLVIVLAVWHNVLRPAAREFLSPLGLRFIAATALNAV